MNAEEARIIATEFNAIKSDTQYKKIIEHISDQAKKGKFDCDVYEDIREDVRKKLMNGGFMVSVPRSGGPNEAIVKISWNEEQKA